MSKLAYKRILLKLSGEVLGKRGGGIDPNKIVTVVKIIKSAYKAGAEIGIVVGGGNWWRKRDADQTIKPAVSDYIGMIGTVINGMALASYLDKVGIKTLLQAYLVSAPGVKAIDTKKAKQALRLGQVVIFAGGTGKPFVTTDTAAAVFARDIKANAIFKVGDVDGVYSADPDKNSRAYKYSSITFTQAIKMRLKIFDLGAYEICRRAKIPVLVFKWSKTNLMKALQGQHVGTIIE